MVSEKTSGAPSMVKAMSPSTHRLKPVAVTMMSASSRVPDFSRMPALREALDLVGHHRDLAVGDGLEHVAVRDEGQALLPGAVARREVALDVAVGADVAAHGGEQLLLHRLRLGDATPGEDGLLVEDLASHDLVDPRRIHLQPPQLVGDVDGVATDAEVCGRSLQHGDVSTVGRHRGDHRGRGGAGADDDDPLAR